MKVFISYRRAQGGIAYAYILYQQLSKLGIDCFFDMEGMKTFSDDFDKKIEQEINSSDYVIVLLQPGCMKSRKKGGEVDYYIKEIRLASPTPKKLIFVSTSSSFDWKKEKIPKDIRSIAKLNIIDVMDISRINNSISNIINSFSLDDRNKHYALLNTLVDKSGTYSRTRIYHQFGDMVDINLKDRWHNAKRISLLAMGCSSIISGDHAPLVHEKFMDNVEFRLIGTNPMSPYIDYIHKSRLNNYVIKDNTIGGYNDGVRSSIDKMVKSNPNGKIEYRLTNDVIDFTIQLVECENDEESYVFVEYIPTKAEGVFHRRNACVTISKRDSLYKYYEDQFNMIWDSAEVNYKNG